MTTGTATPAPPTAATVSPPLYTVLRGKAAQLVSVRVRVTPNDRATTSLPLLFAARRLLRTGYDMKLCPQDISGRTVMLVDKRFGRPIAIDGIKWRSVAFTEDASAGRHTMSLPSGVLRRTASRPEATANLSKSRAATRAKQERAGRKPAKNNAPAAPIKSKVIKLIKNHFVLVADASSSMSPHAAGAARLFNAQLAQLAEGNRTGEQLNTVTMFRFKDPNEIRELYYGVAPGDVRTLDSASWEANGGSTPLYDAVIDAARRAEADTDPERSFVVFVLTDGEENASRRYDAAALRAYVEKQQATDRWTFVFMVPRGYAAKFAAASGIPAGNIKEWSSIGDAEVRELNMSTQSYMAERTSGARSSKSWFTTDLSGIGTTDLAQLRDVTGEVNVWTVDAEEDVRTFVDRKSRGKFDFGMRFFEFTKKEDGFADYKKLLLMDRITKRVYADGTSKSVRQLVGLPVGRAGGTVAIDPTASNLGNFALFGQSTSTNRILPRGQRVAFWS